MVHVAHAHVPHGQQRPVAQRRDLAAHAEPGRQRRDPHAGAVDGLGDDRVGAVLAGLDDHVIGLGRGDSELVDRDGPHVLAVGGDDGHRQAGNPQVEDRLRARIDDPQPHALARTEQAGPVLLRAVAVDQIGIGRARDVEDVGRVHPHLRPHHPLRLRHPMLGVAGQPPRQRHALPVEEAALLLEALEDQVRVELAPVAEHDDMLAVIGDGIGLGGIQDEGAVMAFLLLQPRMAVIPVGAGLDDRELVDKGLARPDAREAHAGHAVHLEREDHAVPVDARVLLKAVGHLDPHILSFAQPDERCRQGAVHHDRVAGVAADRERLVGDGQRDPLAR